MRPLITVVLCLLALSLSAQQPYQPNRIDKLTAQLAENPSIPLGPVDINLGNMFRLSQMRGLYLGVHVSTNDRFSKHFRITGFNGFWTRLRDFDYGIEGKWLINRELEAELGMRYAHKSIAMGEFGGFSEGANLLSENEYRFTFYENVLVRGNFTEVFLNTCFARHFKAYLTAGTYDKNYYLAPFDTLPTTRHVMAEAKLRFAKPGSEWPVVWVAYQHAFEGMLGGTAEFDRVKVQVEKDFQTQSIGRTSLMVQMGYSSKGCPVTESFGLIGSYLSFGLYAPRCFATMREDEFFCDRFAALFLSHDFQGTLWKPDTPWFQPQLSLVTNLAWGAPSLQQGYFESGFVVHGLLVLPTSKMGAGVFYRYGAYAYPGVFDNFAFKWCITIGL